jgi:dihydroxyacetone kinase-like predicted kinase
VKRGDHIALDPDDGLLACDGDRTQAIVAALGRFEPGFELVTVYHGRGVSRREVEQVRDALAESFPDVAVELVDGGQPHYSFLVAAE